MTIDTASRPRIVLIGCGEIGMAAHLPGLAMLQREGVLELVGVCDLDGARAESAALRYGVATWGTEWVRVCGDSHANAVAVCTLPGPNAEIAIAALAAGFHVLCEKPPGRSEAQARLMAEAAAARPDLITMVAFNRRFAPLLRRGRERSLPLGPAHSFAARFTRAALGREPSNAAVDWVSCDGAHALDIAIATIGVPHEATVGRRSIGGGPDNSWLIQLYSEQGHATVWLDFAAGRRLERFEWAGPGYDVALELPDHGTWKTFAGGTETWRGSDVSGSDDVAVNYGFRDEHRAFAEAIAGDAPRPEPDFAYGALLMRIIAQILDARSGETCRIQPLNVPIQTKPDAVTAGRTFRRGATRPVVAVLQPADAARRHFAASTLAELASDCELRFPTRTDPFAGIVDAEAVVLGWGAPPLPTPVLDAAKRLRFAVVLGASVRWALPAKAFAPGRLTICNTADAIAQSVAEHCLLLTLAGLRRLTEVDAAMHAGSWPVAARPTAALPALVRRLASVSLLQRAKRRLKPAAERMLARVAADRSAVWHDLRGQTVGLVGWGHSARRFAELLQPFDCPLLVCSEHAGAEELRRFAARRASIGEVLAAARVVSLHKGMSVRNRGLIGRELIASMPQGSVLVNTARAGLLDEAALVERARKHDIVLALDVFTEEPLPKRHPLRRLRNVILTPHNASATPECARRAGEQALALLCSWARGGEPATLNAARLSEMT